MTKPLLPTRILICGIVFGRIRENKINQYKKHQLDWCFLLFYFCFMTVKKATTRAFYKEVREAFAHYANKKEKGVNKYTKDWCLVKVAEKYHRSPATIENIVFNRV